MALSKEETYQVLALIEEKINSLKLERDRLDEYYQQAKKDVASWSAALTRIEKTINNLCSSIRTMKEDSDA
jgi:chromosome segregation ATPase